MDAAYANRWEDLMGEALAPCGYMGIAIALPTMRWRAPGLAADGYKAMGYRILDRSSSMELLGTTG
jgi:hypothetical protein